ncbi:MAG: hypothetical protein HC888_08440 [Candidatus Competibacteraceae bacterium]|nr:hypothetical protein [Candidatus Competibacteraceae bacterium]
MAGQDQREGIQIVDAGTSPPNMQGRLTFEDERETQVIWDGKTIDEIENVLFAHSLPWCWHAKKSCQYCTIVNTYCIEGSRASKRSVASGKK